MQCLRQHFRGNRKSRNDGNCKPIFLFLTLELLTLLVYGVLLYFFLVWFSCLVLSCIVVDRSHDTQVFRNGSFYPFFFLFFDLFFPQSIHAFSWVMVAFLLFSQQNLDPKREPYGKEEGRRKKGGEGWEKKRARRAA